MKKWISYGILCLLIPAVILAGATLFTDRQYAWICLCVAVLSCIPFFLFFEQKESDAKELLLVAVMVALSVVGRFLFSPVPGFKPVTAMVVITAMYFGSEAGFMTGALTAVVSNFYFGQGPWTPFQMFVWGFVGLVAGLIPGVLKKSRGWLALYGVVSGVLFSCLMDVWTVLSMDGTFNLARYGAAVFTSLEFTAVYAVSNVIFLLLFAKPVGMILDRIRTKYGIGVSRQKS